MFKTALTSHSKSQKHVQLLNVSKVGGQSSIGAFVSAKYVPSLSTGVKNKGLWTGNLVPSVLRYIECAEKTECKNLGTKSFETVKEFVRDPL